VPSQPPPSHTLWR